MQSDHRLFICFLESIITKLVFVAEQAGLIFTRRLVLIVSRPIYLIVPFGIIRIILVSSVFTVCL